MCVRRLVKMDCAFAWHRIFRRAPVLVPPKKGAGAGVVLGILRGEGISLKIKKLKFQSFQVPEFQSCKVSNFLSVQFFKVSKSQRLTNSIS